MLRKKVGKERYFRFTEATVHVNLKVYLKTAKVEVTIPSLSSLRAEETSPDLYASIDLVVDKLERQIRKFKTKSTENLVKQT